MCRPWNLRQHNRRQRLTEPVFLNLSRSPVAMVALGVPCFSSLSEVLGPLLKLDNCMPLAEPATACRQVRGGAQRCLAVAVTGNSTSQLFSFWCIGTEQMAWFSRVDLCARSRRHSPALPETLGRGRQNYAPQLVLSWNPDSIHAIITPRPQRARKNIECARAARRTRRRTGTPGLSQQLSYRTEIAAESISRA